MPNPKNTAHVINRIYQSALKFLVPLTPEETYKTIVNEGVKLANGKDGFLVRQEGDVLKTVYGSSKNAAQVVVRPRGYTYESIKANKAFVIHAKDIAITHPDIVGDNIRTTLFIPLSYQNQSVGALVIRAFTEKVFTRDELGVLKLFGSLASLSIRKMQLYNDTQKALETRDLFIALASHELKTPLTTINVYVKLLYDRVLSSLPINEKWVKNLFMETVRMTQLVNELLHVDQIEKGQLQYLFKEHRLGEIVERAVSDFQVIFPQHRVKIKNAIDGRDFFTCDYDKLLQVLINLLTNAAKFSDPLAPITIVLSQRNNHFTIRVRDRGKGIPKKELSSIFNQFYKGKSNKKDGMGLGLYLTKSIIEQHKGKISVKSVLKKGTMIEISLPR